MAGLLVAFLVAWLTRGLPYLWLAFDRSPFYPWSILTYPFADTGNGFALIFLLFELLWLYWIGTSVEREVGSAKYAGLWVAMTVIPALVLGFGSWIMGQPVPLAGANLPLAGLTVAWGVRNSESRIMLYGIIPLTGKVIAILTTALVFFGYGTIHFAYAFLAIAHLAVAFLFATNRIPGFTYTRPVYQYKPSKQKIQEESQFYEEVKKRETERKEKERLRKLFESSGLDDPDK
jgi:membrane associated rhomboid family serine protease